MKFCYCLIEALVTFNWKIVIVYLKEHSGLMEVFFMFNSSIAVIEIATLLYWNIVIV